jgi:hypothetical protein
MNGGAQADRQLKEQPSERPSVGKSTRSTWATCGTFDKNSMVDVDRTHTVTIHTPRTTHHARNMHHALRTTHHAPHTTLRATAQQSHTTKQRYKGVGDPKWGGRDRSFVTPTSGALPARLGRPLQLAKVHIL